MGLVELSDGRQATYDVIGDGEPLLMFVGGPGLAVEFMRPDATLLSERFRSYMIDPHGSGGSSPPATVGEYDHLGHARFYDEVRQALGLDEVSVHGSSFGGTVALTYAALFPAHTRRCIAVDAFGFGTELDQAEGGAAAAEMEAMLQRHSGSPWFVEARANWDSWTERVLAATDHHTVDEMMRAVLPLYCAHPDREDVAGVIEETRPGSSWTWPPSRPGRRPLPVDRPRAAAGRDRLPDAGVDRRARHHRRPGSSAPDSGVRPGADLATFADCGHFPSIEAPQQYRRAILSWVDQPAKI